MQLAEPIFHKPTETNELLGALNNGKKKLKKNVDNH